MSPLRLSPLALFYCLLVVPTLVVSLMDTLFDVPVSNHGARIRLISKLKNLDLQIRSPVEIGGLKSVEYSKISIQGKMPVLVTSDGFSIVESDCIARYLLDKHSNTPPTLIPSNLYEKSLSDQICRVHDVYISPIQGCMYKAPGTMFSTFGTDRKAALAELKRQLVGIESMLASLDSHTTLGANRPFLCGSEISLADITLFPTILFCDFMLPLFFGVKREEYLGVRLRNWYDYMSTLPSVVDVKAEMMPPLDGWIRSGRFDPIIKEMASN